MPINIQIATFVLGAILVLLAIAGGNIQFPGGRIDKDISPRMRVVSGFLGILFVLVGLFYPFSEHSPSEATVTPPSLTGTDTSATSVSIETSEPERTKTPTVIVTLTPLSTTPIPTPTALIDAYSGAWINPDIRSGTLPFALYRLKIENVNSQNGTATFNVCRCAQKTCTSKNKLTPLLVSAHFEGSKLVAEPVYIDQQRTIQWMLKAIRVGQNLMVTVEENKGNVRIAGPEDFVLNPLKSTIDDAQVFIDDCQPPPEVYLVP